jgi:hypothetical protein
MEQGWIYVLVNSSIPGLVKVGRTSRPPAERVAELSAATGVATPFVLAFEQAFADCIAAEQAVHAELDRRGLRAAANREFFRGSPNDIIRVILDVADTAVPGATRRAAPSAADLMQEGDRHLFGTGETLQDLAEAVRCYRLAAARGSLLGLERLGTIYAQIANGRADRRRAMRCLKDGARRGNYYCYCEMALLFARDGHLPNFQKAWDIFFARRADSYCDEVEVDPARYARAVRAYLVTCFDLNLPPSHLAELRAAADALIRCLLDSLEQLRDEPADRQRVARVLRWAYLTLAPDQQPTRPARRSPLWRRGWFTHGGRALA